MQHIYFINFRLSAMKNFFKFQKPSVPTYSENFPIIKSVPL